MKIEAFLASYLAAYYILLIFVVGISTFLNSPKERRLKQTKIAKLYILYVILSTMVLYINYAYANVPQGSLGNSGFAALLMLFAGWFSLNYAKFSFWVIGLSLVLKFLFKNDKFVLIRFTKDTLIPAITSSFSTNIDVAEKEEAPKRNFIMKIFFDANDTLNEKGILVCKISKILTIALIMVYIALPILLKFDILLISSRVGLLLFIMTFLELHYALTFKKVNLQMEPKQSNIKGLQEMELVLKNSLLLNEKETLKEKRIGKKEITSSGPSALICEIANLNELKELNLKVMNQAFFENKKVLVICLNEKSAKEYHRRLTIFNKEYDGKLVIKLITKEDKLFDNSVDIYVTAIENCFGNIKLLSEIDTIILEDYDEILLNKLELLRALGSIVRMGNPEMNYIVLTYMLRGIEATIKSLLFVKDLSCYCPTSKYQSKTINLKVWEKNDNVITEKVLGKSVQNFGSLVPISILGAKRLPDRILMISKNEPLEFELNELNAIRNLEDVNVYTPELKILNDRAKICTKEKYFGNIKKNLIITDDKNNFYEKIYKLSLINGIENEINIISEQYLLRDYMISTYQVNRANLKAFLPYAPYEVNSGKVVLYNLLLQLTNFGVKETVIANVLNANGMNVRIGKGNNVRMIADKLNEFIRQEFDISVDLYSYITIQEVKEKYIFDLNKKEYVEEEKNYILDESALKLFPNEIFGRVSFVKDGFELDIEKEYAYNFYQKYLPGQKHYLNGYVYEIKNTIETDEGINAIVEASTNYDNRTYRQDRRVKIINPFVATETRMNKYSNVMVEYQVGNMGYEIETKGYFEFKNGISKKAGEYRYVGLDSRVVEKTIRKHKKADTLKIQIDLENQMEKDISLNDYDSLGEKISFLITEVLVSLIGENSKYIQVKSAQSTVSDTIIGESWVQPIRIEGSTNKLIEIYIMEDTQIERGLIDMIYKNLDNIFEILHDYLEWLFTGNNKNQEVRAFFLTNMDETNREIREYNKIYQILRRIRFK